MAHYFLGRAGFDFITLTGSDIGFTRNAMASLCLQDASYSHLLFIDSDMGFEPTLIEKMLRFDKPVVGVAYPVREFDRSKMMALLEEGSPRDRVDAGTAVRHGPRAARAIWRLYAGVQGGYRHYADQAREVFAAIAEKLPHLLWQLGPGAPQYAAWGVRNQVLQCFTRTSNPAGLHAVEDFSFCAYWRNGCRGEIWACIDESITHMGTENFRGSYLQFMQANEAVRKARSRADYTVTPTSGIIAPVADVQFSEPVKVGMPEA